MKKGHIILTAPCEMHSGGKLNTFLSGITKKFLEEKGYVMTITSITKGYDIKEEQQRYLDSELIVYHFPVWWFQVPHYLKKYLDDIFEYKVIFGPSSGKDYGYNGLLKGKRYFASLTMNAPEFIFNNGGDYFAGDITIDELYNGFHYAQMYAGMQKLKSIFHCDVIHGDTSSIEEDHLKKLAQVNLL